MYGHRNNGDITLYSDAFYACRAAKASKVGGRNRRRRRCFPAWQGLASTVSIHPKYSQTRSILGSPGLAGLPQFAAFFRDFPRVEFIAKS
jgi:hypothetical protein